MPSLKPKVFDSLSPKQKKAIPLLASGMTNADVSSEINCNPATVSQWRNHDTAFKAALYEFSLSLLENAQQELLTLSIEAVMEARKLLGTAQSESIKLSLIRFIIEESNKLYQQQHISHSKDQEATFASAQFNPLAFAELLGISHE